MPTCPNCGSYIPLGDHSCSCGTTIRYDEPQEESSGYAYEIAPDDNPYDYDFLNDFYHNYENEIYLNQMNRGIAEIEQKYNAKFREAIQVMDILFSHSMLRQSTLMR